MNEKKDVFAALRARRKLAEDITKMKLKLFDAAEEILRALEHSHAITIDPYDSRSVRLDFAGTPSVNEACLSLEYSWRSDEVHVCVWIRGEGRITVLAPLASPEGRGYVKRFMAHVARHSNNKQRGDVIWEQEHVVQRVGPSWLA